MNEDGLGNDAYWSLLMLDTRAPKRVVDHHYESAGSRNSTIAEQLAAKLAPGCSQPA
ncbi:hypothetical protein ML401_35365 (plasmid) [Bradyrhizobium sp. 62B]|uniref:hypothetical protein n=1 Tax=Bradyrhizobium sp. 62B TaxID=2898442 RepID=UPI0025580A84|nr:hypothetical protein ML401_35365 [Bradyrhizobium sp. 62B]